MNITELPFNKLVGLRQSDREGAYLYLPAEKRYTNHLDTVHAGALVALAESTSGEYLFREFSKEGLKAIPVIRKLESKFKKPAVGEVFSKVSMDGLDREEFLSQLKTKGRARITVRVELFDSQEALVQTSMVEWFIALK